MENLDVGPTPSDEDCAQIGDSDYYDVAKSECRRYMTGLTLLFPPPIDAYFKIQGNPHDYGVYFSVAGRFNPENNDHLNWCRNLERDLPKTWAEMDLRISNLRHSSIKSSNSMTI